jgi:hypothetical protein
VLVLPRAENASHVEKTVLYHYTYNWPVATSSGESRTHETPSRHGNPSPPTTPLSSSSSEAAPGGILAGPPDPAPATKTVATQAVVFGLGSLFNHSSRNQNVGWRRDLRRLVIVYTALRDIRVGEELCISYGANLTFADADDDGGGGEDEGEGRGEVDDDVLALGRIEVD